MPDPYALQPEPEAPDLPGDAVVRATREDVLDALCADLLLHAEACVRSFGDFHLFLSGGPAVEAMCVKLMIDPAFRRLPWGRTHLWLASELLGSVPAGRGAAEAFEDILQDHADIPARQIHGLTRQQAAAGPALAAESYERTVQESLGWRERGQDRPDCVLLSIDGPVPIAAAARPHYALFAPSEDPQAISVTARLLAGTRLLGLIGLDDASRDVVTRAVAGASDHDAWRAASPVAGQLRWFLTESACPAGAR